MRGIRASVCGVPSGRVLAWFDSGEFERTCTGATGFPTGGGKRIVTLPTANLFLQGRGEARPTARGLTRVAELIGRGVPLASASDNIQDAFVPIGSGDMLELARWTILAGHLLRNEPALAFDMITRVPGRLLGLGVQDIAPGEWANFLVTEMSDVTDLVRTGPLQRTVFYRGRVV